MQTIRRTPECVERSDSVWSALNHRDRVIKASSGLGPVDLVCLRKRGGNEEREFFHHVLGNDVTSTASAAAYFAHLCTSAEKANSLLGLLASSELEVCHGIYCCFDAFTKEDVRCVMASPGGVRAYATDASGRKRRVSMRQWEQTAVSAFLRYEAYDPAMLANVPGFVRLHAMASPDMEDAVLESVVSLYHEGIAQRALKRLMPPHWRGYTRPEHNDPILAAVLQHFARLCAWDSAVELFAQLAESHKPAAIQLSVALARAGRPDDALQTLRASALRAPQHADTVLCLAHAESEAGHHGEACALARHALHLNIASTTAACTVMTVMARAGLLKLARAALHLVPEPPAAKHALKALWPLGIPPHASVTQPAQPFFDPDIAEASLEARTCSAELADSRAFEVCHALDDSTLATSLLHAPATGRGAVYGVLSTALQLNGASAVSVLLPAAEAGGGAAAAAPHDSAPLSSHLPSGPHSRERTRVSIQRRSGTASSREVLVEAGATAASGGLDIASTTASSSSGVHPRDLWHAVFGAARRQRGEAVGGGAHSGNSRSIALSSPLPVLQPHISADLGVSAPVGVEPHARAYAWRRTDPDGQPVAEAEARPCRPFECWCFCGAPTSAPRANKVTAASKPSGRCSHLERPTAAALVAPLRALARRTAQCWRHWFSCVHLRRSGDSASSSLASSLSSPLLQAGTEQQAEQWQGASPPDRGPCSHGERAIAQPQASAGTSLSLPVPHLVGGVIAGQGRERSALVATGAQGRGSGHPGAQRRPQAARGQALCEADEALAVASGVSRSAPLSPPRGPSPIRELRDAVAAHLARSGGAHGPHGHAPLDALRQLAQLQVRAQEYTARLDVAPARPRDSLAGAPASSQSGRARGQRGAAEACPEGAPPARGQRSAAWVARHIVDESRIARRADKLRSRALQSAPADQWQCRILDALLLCTDSLLPASLPSSKLVRAGARRVLHDTRLASAAFEALSGDGNSSSRALPGASQALASADSTLLPGPPAISDVRDARAAARPAWMQAEPRAHDAEIDRLATALRDEHGAGLWEACGAASERLGCYDLAKAAYRHACSRDTRSCVSAHLGLMRLCAAEGGVAAVFEHATDVLIATHGAGPDFASEHVSRRVLATLSRLVAVAGMRAVQEVLERSAGQVHPLVEVTMELAFESGTDGCDC